MLSPSENDDNSAAPCEVFFSPHRSTTSHNRSTPSTTTACVTRDNSELPPFNHHHACTRRPPISKAVEETTNKGGRHETTGNEKRNNNINKHTTEKRVAHRSVSSNSESEDDATGSRKNDLTPQRRVGGESTNKLMSVVLGALPAPIRNSFRSDDDEQGDDYTDERTPLTTSRNISKQSPAYIEPRPTLLDPFPGDEQQDHPSPPSNPNNAQHAWEVMREQVQSGILLIRRNSSQWETRTESERLARTRQAQERIKSGFELSLRQCLALVLVFMGLGVVAFSFLFDRWSFIDAMYFSLVTCTTVGYGDLVPDTTSGLIFTSIYALLGVCALGIALGVLGNHVLETQQAAVTRTHTLVKQRWLSLFSHTASTTTPTTKQQQEQAAEEVELFVYDENQKKPNIFLILSFRFACVMVLLTVFALLIAQDPGIDVNGNGRADIVDAMYFTIVTATTIGYGDMAPVTQRGRLLGIFFIPIAVGAMGHFLSGVAQGIMDTRAESVRQDMVASREQQLSIRDLELMDADGDGNVTRAEFLEFMLIAMGKVDKDFIDELRMHFEKLDTNKTGILSKQTLIEQARRKLGRIQHKLELGAYKHKLLQQGHQHTAQQRHRRSAHYWVANQVRQTFRHVQSSMRRGFRALVFCENESINNNDISYYHSSCILPSTRFNSCVIPNGDTVPCVLEENNDDEELLLLGENVIDKDIL